MMGKRSRAATTIAGLNVLALALLVEPAGADAASNAHFVHAIPGAGPATLMVVGKDASRSIGPAAFGTVAGPARVPSGPVRLELRSAGHDVVLAPNARLGDGANETIVALAAGRRPVAGVYPAPAARPGHAVLEVIHAAPELGAPTLRLGAKTIAPVARYRQATPPVAVAPGTYRLTAGRPGGHGPPVLAQRVRLDAGRAYTAVVVGSEGQSVRVVTFVDDTVRTATTPAPTHGHAAGARQRHGAGAPQRPARSAPSTTSSAHAGWTIVRPGQSLWSIAQARLGPRASGSQVAQQVHRLWATNARRIGSGDPDLVYAGQKLRLG